MITVFSGTDRPESNSSIIAGSIIKILENQGLGSDYFSLTDWSPFSDNAGAYGAIDPAVERIIETFIQPATHIVFIIPEYNGSFPGILKLFLDLTRPEVWAGKKAALVGVATGRSGNLRGLDHMTAVLHYLKVEVYHQKLPLSGIHLSIDDTGILQDAEYRGLLEEQIDGFKKF